MIRNLQKKFIFSAMMAVTILLVLLLGALNAGNAHVTARQNEELLDALLRSETMTPPPRDIREPKGFFSAPTDENARNASVYFTVSTDRTGIIRSVDTSRVAGLSESDAKELFSWAAGQNSSEGKIESYRYQSAVNVRDGNNVYLFLDTGKQANDVLRVAVLSCLIGCICWAAMLLLVILLSKKAIRPIAENIERQKQFITDAGHEIKTPLAIILSNTEAMELYTGESKWSKNIKEQVNHLTGLTQSLLTLAKAGEHGLTASTEVVSLTTLTEDVSNQFTENAALKNIRIEKDIRQNVTGRVNPALFSQLVSILMDNAVKYTCQNGKISLLLCHQEKRVRLAVSNSCEPLPPCPAERLFDRFYRADSARTQGTGGYGIGLSAAKSIAEAHGGTIRAEYRDGNTVVFTVLL